MVMVTVITLTNAGWGTVSERVRWTMESGKGEELQGTERARLNLGYEICHFCS